VQLRVNRVVRQPAFRGLGDAEVDHLRHRHAVVQRHEDVRGLDVAVDDPLLVRVLDGLANLDEQIEPFLRGEIGLIAVVGDLDPPDQFHHEIGPAHVGGARIQHLAMLGWSIIASACRSASNRATTCLVSMPSLMTLSTTRRRTGSVCSAT
jgi:hypothetical protein